LEGLRPSKFFLFPAKQIYNQSTARQAVDMAREYKISTVQRLALAALGNVCQALLMLEEAREAHGEALALDAVIMQRRFAATISDELCAEAAMASDWALALRYARQALELRKTSELYFYTGLTLWCTVDALLRGGDRAYAHDVLDRFGARIGANPRYRIAYLRAQAVIDRARAAEAAGLGAAASLARELALPGQLWPILAELGASYRAQGDDERASQAFAEAAAIVHQLAARMEDDELRARFLAAPAVREVLQGSGA
jgi:hypothetical protein